MKKESLDAASILEKVREKKPLVHVVTNIVSANITANALLACGALPVMAIAPEETCDMAGNADALVLNIGTPTSQAVEGMVKAGQAGCRKGIPVVLDPVGVGSTQFRNQITQKLLTSILPHVIRGNPAEISFLSGKESRIRGVQAVDTNVRQDSEISIQDIARKLKAVVAVTGSTDYVSDGSKTYVVRNGHPLMSRLTGSGCVASAVIAAFCSVETNFVLASACALSFLGIAGQLAAEVSEGPGSFQVKWLDFMAGLTGRQLTGLLDMDISVSGSEPCDE